MFPVETGSLGQDMFKTPFIGHNYVHYDKIQSVSSVFPERGKLWVLNELEINFVSN